MEIKPEEFRPKVKGQSDFYSWQLYRWLKKYKDRSRIYCGTWNSFSGHDYDKPTLYIGFKFDDDDDFIGNGLRSICHHGASLKSWCFARGHHTHEWEDVSEWFWREYRRIGVCAIHGDFAHNYVGDEIERKCAYCGKEQRQVVLVKTESIWVDK